VVTELNLVGTVAQYGRGVGLMRDIADQLIGQFARNLEDLIRSAASEDASIQPTEGKPASGLTLIGGAIKAAAKRKFGGAP
jgi:hypothetical protein